MAGLRDQDLMAGLRDQDYPKLKHWMLWGFLAIPGQSLWLLKILEQPECSWRIKEDPAGLISGTIGDFSSQIHLFQPTWSSTALESALRKGTTKPGFDRPLVDMQLLYTGLHRGNYHIKLIN